MWECLSRCRDLPGGAAIYRLPYERELGGSPTDETYQDYVVSQKLRPKLYHYDHGPDGQEIIREKWDSGSGQNFQFFFVEFLMTCKKLQFSVTCALLSMSAGMPMLRPDYQLD